MRDAFFRELTRLAQQDERIVLLVGDLGYKLFDELAALCPGRVYNMGVSEANMVSVAAGLALEKMRPVTYSIVPFATIRCLEQIRDDVCAMGLPVLIVGVGGGYAYGVNGPTHHGVDDLAVLRAQPGMTVLCPCDPNETAALLRAALSLEGPAYLRLGRVQEPNLTNADTAFMFGRPTVLRDGHTVALVACGPIVKEALDAAASLAALGLDPLVVSVHMVKPIDATIEFLLEASPEHVFVVEEHGPYGGLAEAVAAGLLIAGACPGFRRISAPDRFLHDVGSQNFLRRQVGIDAAAIAQTVARALGLGP
jgi:transketolase